jgi:hypothetical protein
MVVPATTFTFDVADAAVWPLLTDPVGGTATYGTKIDVPGINNVSVEPEFISAVLKGDAKTLARRARIDSLNFSAGYSLLSPELIGVLYDGTHTAAVGEEDATTLEISGAGSLPYVMFGFSILDAEVGVGCINVYGLKCQVTGGNLFEQSTESFGGRSFQISAIPLLSNNRMFKTLIHPTVTPLAAS